MIARIFSFALTLLFSSTTYADVITVTDLTDDLDLNNGTCNLREAVRSARIDLPSDACPSGNGEDIIIFKTGGMITLQAEIFVSTSVEIRGPGSQLLTISGDSNNRVFKIAQSAIQTNVNISGVTLTAGNVIGQVNDDTGGAIYQQTNTILEIADVEFNLNLAKFGGAIFQSFDSELMVKRSTFLRNEAESGGGIYSSNFPGEVILDIWDSTFIANSATEISNNSLPGGGAVLLAHSSSSRSVTNIFRTTFSGNTANQFGGALFATLEPDNNSSINIRHSTFTDNYADFDENGFGDGGGAYFFSRPGVSSYNVGNNLIAGNEDRSPLRINSVPDIGFDDFSGNFNTEGWNLIGDNAGASFFFPLGYENINRDYVGDESSPLSADLDPLADNGGPTLTHMPSMISPSNVIDHGVCPGESRDQRGFGEDDNGPRPVDLGPINSGDGCDIGAVERDGRALFLDVDIKVILSGPFDGTEMDISKEESFVPNNQPYNTPPWSYNGPEQINVFTGDTGDWVLVDLYRGIPGDSPTLIKRQAAILLENGEIRFPTYSGSEYRDLVYGEINAGPYYVVVDHRNHLPVLNSVPLTLSWDEPAEYDFTQSLDAALSNGGLAMQALPNDNFGMWGGDGDKDASTTAFDFLNTWLPFNGGPIGYFAGDFNLDAQITAFDFSLIWLPANGQSSQVP